ncbi:MAG: mechanosensitive ion channel family protein [Proteobacteria bacterium]|nr:mechanosensitive ion channel family protein [Pseudomonadota bacterium]
MSGQKMIEQFLDNTIQRYVESSMQVRLISELITITAITGFAIIAYYIVKLFTKYYIKRFLINSDSEFLHLVASKNGIATLAHLASALTFRVGSNFITRHNDFYAFYLALIVNKLSMLYLFITIIIVITGIIKTINPYYENQFEFSKLYPIKQYINVSIFMIWLLSAVFIIAFFANSSLTRVFTAIGAASAVFLLIFRDTLLGIVSSIQAATSNIVRVGDRICIDKYNLDGTVINIAINSVRIKNSDNTVATIPTYMLTSEVVKNWRTLEEYGTRRIKRSIFVDINSIRLMNPEEIKKIIAIKVLGDFINKCDNLKEISNLTFFRIFLENYLNEHQYISNKNIIMIRHLELTPAGLPLEIYAFTAKINGKEFEQLVSEIIEYCFISMPLFALKPFQNSSS